MGRLFQTALFRLLTGTGILVAMLSQPVWAYHHHHSKLQYHAYGKRTFALARQQNKPVFMVLSARWCYWCAFYERETLEKEPVATFLNQNFINVFVDLDQRQDLQHRYVKKGIPTSVVFTPGGDPYLSFSGMLEPQAFLTGIKQVLTKLKNGSPLPSPETPSTVTDVRPFLTPPATPVQRSRIYPQRHQEFMEIAQENFSEEKGGFGQSKQYPLGALLGYLLQPPAAPSEGPAGAALRDAAFQLLERVHRHLYDPVEGGFFRYAEGGNWNRTRHEKMLTTNAELLRIYQLAGRYAPDPKRRRSYRAAYAHSLRFFLDTYVGSQGGLAGSLDGKKPGYYRLSSLAKRLKATRPTLDRTIYTAWNGQAIYALIRIYQQEPTPRIRRVIIAGLDYLKNHLFSPNHGLYSLRRADASRGTGLGRLKDNSWGALALISGYALSEDKSYLDAFERILNYMNQALRLPEGRVYRMWNVPLGRSRFRQKGHISDEVPLAENSVTAYALIKAHVLTGNSTYRLQAQKLLHALSTLPFDEFIDDPHDEGRQYLLKLVYYLEALRQFEQAGSFKL